jgi:hypothetical protein
MANSDHPESLQDSQDATKLASVEREYRQAESDFNDACKVVEQYSRTHFDKRFALRSGRGVTTVINAMTNPANFERMRLEAVRELSRQKFMQSLAERAELLRRLGKVR